MYRASFRRKSSAVSLCKSIESAIQWFQIHHGITFVTMHNPAVYLSGARVSISPTLVPRLVSILPNELRLHGQQKLTTTIPIYLSRASM